MIDPVSLVRHIHENLTTNIIQVLLCYLFGFFCLLPLYYRPTSFLEETVLRDSLTSIGYRYSAVATLALAIPFTFDLVADLVFIHKDVKQSNEKAIVKEGFLNNTEKVLFLIGTVMLPIVAFFPEDTKYWAFIYVCCNKCQQVLIFGAVAISLSRYDNSAWTDKTTYAIIISLGLGNVLMCNSTNRLNAIDGPNFSTVLGILEGLALLFVLASALVYLFSIIRWFRGSFKKKLGLPSKTQKISEIIYLLIYTTMAMICIITLVVLVCLYGRLSTHDEAAILVNNLLYFCYILFINFLTMRMVKSEVVQGLYALIESKKVYVRYISHELRTPLNAGLKLLTDDIQASTDPKDADRNDILSDANCACRTALDILNDLLCFDKLENGVLVLHKQEEPVLPFIFDCVAMFSSQARECGVNLSITNPDLRPYHVDTALLPTDMVVMDKFKMDQVLRNLISNALKFTPRGGTVTVSAVYISDEKENGLRRHSTDVDAGMKGHSMVNKVHTTLEIDVEAAESNLIGTRRRSFEGILKKKSKNGMICGKLVIVIKDSGVGLSRINLKRLFKEVVQFNPEVLQAGGGSGLGLWITNMIVVMHNGKITANSAGEGLGCSFTVEIEMERKAVSPLTDVSRHQTTINSSICPHFERPHSERWTATNPSTPNSERCNGDIYREDNTIIEEILSKPSASEDSKDDSSILEALKETIDLVDPFSQQLNIGDSIISVGSRRSSQQQLSNNGDRIISVGSRRSSKQQLSIKGDSIISTGCRKKVSIVATSNVGEIPPYNSRTSTQEELSTYNSRRSSIDSNRRSSSVVIKQNFDILIVDDSGLNRKMLCRLLRASGYVFDEAEDGLLALNKVKAKMSVAVNGSEKGSFGVILMDYIMPNMDGPTATKAIRDLGYTAPIFGLTGNALDSDIAYFMSCGANEVMTKPFDLFLFQELMKKY